MITSVPDVDADVALREAHAAVYRWPSWLAGFGAELRLDGADGRTVTTLRVAGGVPELDPDTTTSGDGAWLSEQVGLLVSHRRPLAYEDGDGAHAKRARPLGEDEVVVEVADAYASRYWIEGGRIARIERTLGETHVDIVVHARIPAGEGEIASDMTVLTSDAETGRVRGLEILRDDYTTVGEVVLPARRRSLRVDEAGTAVARDLHLVGHSVARAEVAS